MAIFSESFANVLTCGGFLHSNSACNIAFQLPRVQRENTSKGAELGVSSMTGYAAGERSIGSASFRWEARSVNGRGLDLRIRAPEGWEALEPEARARAGKALRRGSVTLQLKVEREAAPMTAAVDISMLDASIDAVRLAAERAAAAGLELAPVSPDRLLQLGGGAFEGGRREPSAADHEAGRAAALEALDEALAGLAAARRAEGAALEATLSALLGDIAALSADARAAHKAALEAGADALRDRVGALLGAGAEVNPERLAQELALIAVKADIREELDRLDAHVEAARALLAESGPVGRKLDFMTQEFNREANTLCSKSSATALTAIGLELKLRIDQMREQAANIE